MSAPTIAGSRADPPAVFGGPFPSSDYSQVAGYGGVNLILYLAGFGLILVGHRLGARRRGAQPAVNLDPVR
jgi:hypothetical protein